MSLRKSTALAPALTTAFRRNAPKSIGPHTERGKEWSRVNRLRTGMRSRRFLNFYDALMAAMPGQIRRSAHTAMLPSYLARQPLYRQNVEDGVRTDPALSAEHAETKSPWPAIQAGVPFKQAGRRPAKVQQTPASTAQSGIPSVSCTTAETKKTTFQAGMSMKTNDRDKNNLGDYFNVLIDVTGHGNR